MDLDQKCIFCKIIEKKIPARIVHEDEHSLAFEDLNPQAPIHMLIVPKKHIADIHGITVADREIIGHLFFVAKTIAAQKGLDKSGYRMVINNGRDAGQTVFHIHLHLLSGRPFAWPPG
ncbi:MAG: histidine triad nucleotide-binding protein [Nitrospirota bacterium]|nr:histidine triad nucleotide-binding protein [Nitrospirota bacterium]